MSECNPPCESGTECRARECVVSSKASQKSGPTETEEPSSESSLDEDASRKFVVLAGFGAVVATEGAPALAVAARYQIGNDHAFAFGPRMMVVFPSGNYEAFGIFGADAGYRGIFGGKTVRGGLLAVFQPQIWADNGTVLLNLGAAVGPLIRIGRFEVELPLSLGRIAPTKDYFGSSRLNAAVFTVSALGGIAF